LRIGVLSVAGAEGLVAEPTDIFFLQVQGQPAHLLRKKRDALRQQGIDILRRVKALQDEMTGSETKISGVTDIAPS
jgi:hypothetical protein